MKPQPVAFQAKKMNFRGGKSAEIKKTGKNGVGGGTKIKNGMGGGLKSVVGVGWGG